MPHSSGGGSHGGGFHGGGSHGGYSTRISKNYYAGSKKYVYYHDNRPDFIYSSYDPTKYHVQSLVLSIIVTAIFFSIAVLAAISLAISSTKPLDNSYYYKNTLSMFKTNSGLNVYDYQEPQDDDLLPDYNNQLNAMGSFCGVHIYDTASILKDTSNLEAELNFFYDKTNISPTFVTVNNQDWMNSYSSLSDYAYDLYVDTYADECHWLIVYSQPNHPNPSPDEWYFEGMQGDYTDPIITSEIARKFNKTAYNNLMSNQFSVEDAFANAFHSINQRILKPFSVSHVAIILCLFLFSFIVGAVLISASVPKRKYKNAMECPEDYVEEACVYCGGIYIANFHTTCPYCKRIIPRYESADNKNDNKNIIQ